LTIEEAMIECAKLEKHIRGLDSGSGDARALRVLLTGVAFLRNIIADLEPMARRELMAQKAIVAKLDDELAGSAQFAIDDMQVAVDNASDPLCIHMVELATD
jgi:hypothetical protein